MLSLPFQWKALIIHSFIPAHEINNWSRRIISMQNKAYSKNEHARFLGIDCSSDCGTKSCLNLSINATKCCLILIQNKFNSNLRKSRSKFSKPTRHNSRSHQVFALETKNHISPIFHSRPLFTASEITLHKFVCCFTLACHSALFLSPTNLFFPTIKIIVWAREHNLERPAQSIDWIMDFLPAEFCDVWLTTKQNSICILWFRFMLINWMSSHFDVLLSCAPRPSCWIMCRDPLSFLHRN